MCGRFQLDVTWDELAVLYGAPGPLPPGFGPSWSVCPTHDVAALRRDTAGQRVLASMRWGFPMTWLSREGKDPWSRPLINAKAEEAASKRTWSKPLRERRCVVPATAFIEWVRVGKRAYPVRFAPTSSRLLHLAALWSQLDRDGVPTDVVTLLTVAPSADIIAVHDRMPALLDASAIDAWLDPRAPADAIAALLRPAPDGALAPSPLPTSMNKAGGLREPPGPADWAFADFAPTLARRV